MTATEARSFVVGKLFTFNCFEGTKGAGRIHADGSVAGTIQFRGSGPVRWAQLPAEHDQRQGRSGLRHREGAAVPALLQSAEDEPQELPRLGLRSRLRVLRIHPPRSGGNRNRQRAGQSAVSQPLSLRSTLSTSGHALNALLSYFEPSFAGKIMHVVVACA